MAASAITYLEGYLFDPPLAKNAFREAATIARGAGRKVALTLSGSFCVHRDRDEFKALICDHLDSSSPMKARSRRFTAAATSQPPPTIVLPRKAKAGALKLMRTGFRQSEPCFA